MVAAMESGVARKQKAGAVLLTIGGLALFMQLWAFWLETGMGWSRAAASFGWPGALAMAVLRVAGFVAWNPNGILLSVARVLLLFWPMAVMAAGAVLSRRAG